MTIIQKSALIKFSAQTMFELVDDIESYPEFLPWCAGSKIIRREKDIVEAELKISRGGFTKTFSTRNVSDAGGRIRLSLPRWKAAGTLCRYGRMPVKYRWILNLKCEENWQTLRLEQFLTRFATPWLVHLLSGQNSSMVRHLNSSHVSG